MKKSNILLILILLLTVFLHGYKIDSIPATLYGDELSFGYNAWSVMTTGKDEYGVLYPLEFRSFGDYKSPLPVYLLIPFIKIFDLSIQSVRYPMVVVSVLIVFVFYLLVKKLTGGKIALLGALLLSICPWYIHLTRGYFETTIGLLFFICAVYFFIRSSSLRNILLSGLFFAVTLYTYFSYRIMLLLFLPLLLYFAIKKLQYPWKKIILFMYVIALLVSPLVYLTVQKNSFSRMNMILNERNSKIAKSVNVDRAELNAIPEIVQHVFHNKFLYWGRDIMVDYFDHFAIRYLYVVGDNAIRYSIGSFGMLYVVELPLSIIGVLAYLLNKPKFWQVVVFWLLVAPFPAAIASTLFATRSLGLLPMLIFFTAYGGVYIFGIIKSLIWKKIVVALILSGYIVCLGTFFTRYFMEYPKTSLSYWDWEGNTAANIALANQPNYDQIYITDYYANVLLALAFHAKIDPYTYLTARQVKYKDTNGNEFIKLGKFYYGSINPADPKNINTLISQNSLYIGSPKNVKSDEKIIHPATGQLIYYIHRTN